jgi:hypothetical protein
MNILTYNNLEPGKLNDKIKKVKAFLEEGNFRAADVKKMPNTGFYRAKLDDTNRLLFSIRTFENKKYLLILEVILNHAYEKSKFLNGAVIDETKLVSIVSEKDIIIEEDTSIGFINPLKKSFYLLDKILSFDDKQEEILNLPAPIIIIGSAGSGKTALTLEKAKTLTGKILYITLSSYLVENASLLYSSFEYETRSKRLSFCHFTSIYLL